MSRPWTHLYPEGVSEELVGGFATMRDAWDHQVAEHADAAAVHHFDQTLTFAQVDRAADALAAAFQAHGLEPGDRVAAYLQNDPRILVCLDTLHDSVVREVLPATGVRTVITTHPLDLTPAATVPDGLRAHLGPRRSFEDALDWCDLLEEFAGRRPERHPLGPDDVGLLTYTSGTTGRSKGAMNLHRAMVHSSTVFAAWWDLRPGQDVVLGLAPLFHITGMIAGLGAHVVTGSPLVLLHRFDAEETLRAVERWRCTFVVAASTAFIALSNHPALPHHDVSSLTKTPSGGAPVSEALVERVRAATGWELHGAYGMTETTSPTHLGPPGRTPPVDADSGALAVGVPVPGARVRIVDVESGLDLPAGEVGEIVVAGPMVVPGYWQLPEESAHAVRDGWLYTGDVGKMTEDGWLFVVDRLKDMINAGGYKIFPRDVEDVLYQHPAVREASVVGVPDEYRGETVAAFVSLVNGQDATAEQLIGFCRERLAAYKYPRVVHILEELPKTASGKVLKRELRG